MEDLSFIPFDSLRETPYKTFLEKLKSDLPKEDVAFLEKKFYAFKGNKISAQELFDHFVDVFGLRDVN